LKLLLDENIGLKVYYELEKLGFDVKSVYVAARGASDEEVIRLAKDENRIIVTMDKDFGYLALSYSPPGLILLRLRDAKPRNRLRAILRVVEEYDIKLYGYITVVSEKAIRRHPIRLL